MTNELILEKLWEKVIKTGIKPIDEDHRNLVDSLNKLYIGIKNESEYDVIKEVLVDLINYSSYHFRREEELMFKFKCPNYIEHKRKHWEFTRTIIDLSFSFFNVGTGIKENLVSELQKWLVEHTSTMDLEYVECFKENGVE
jgi:hemerythrin